MSDRYGSNPPDEPVIGANYPPAPSPSGNPPQPDYIGADPSWAPARASTPARGPQTLTEYPGDETYSDDYDEYEDGYDDEYYGEDYYDESPVRQPMFYVFIGLAALIGGGLIFLLFALFGGDDDDPGGSAGFRVLIDSPVDNARLEIGKPQDVVVRATSNEQITKFELLVEEEPVDSEAATAPGADDVYSATLQHTFDDVGEYTVSVRVTSSSGATTESDEITVIAIQSVGEKPVEIRGRVVGQASVRSGPGENFEVIRTLDAGDTVDIIGKTRDSSWLLLKDDEGWVRKEAIEPEDSLALVPIKDPTPTPPVATPTTDATPTPSATPTPDADAPDFVPANAVLIDGGSTLRITVQNLATAPYEGPLVVGVANVDVASSQVVVDADIPANGSVTVDFDLNEPITDTGTSVEVTVDPGNAVDESSESNNSATFFLSPAAEAPNLIILAPTYDGGAMAVSIRNDGGELKTSTLVVRVESGGSASEQSQTIALAKGQSANFSFNKPSAGPAKIRVLVNGVQLSAVDIEVP